MRRNNRSRRGKIPQKEYTKHAIIRRTAQCLQGVEGILPKMVDEPTSALDPISTSKIEDLAMELKKDYTIVMVTHNMQQAVRVSDNTAFFLLGEVVEYNNTEKLFSIPQNKKTEDYISELFWYIMHPLYHQAIYVSCAFSTIIYAFLYISELIINLQCASFELQKASPSQTCFSYLFPTYSINQIFP